MLNNGKGVLTTIKLREQSWWSFQNHLTTSRITLMIAKLAAYGFDRNALKRKASYLRDCKQAVKIKRYIGVLKLIISGVPQGSILGPILLTISINDLFYLINSE